MKFNNIIRQVAKQNGVSPDEVKRDIREAARVGMTSVDPTVQKYWQTISPTGKEPSIDDLLAFLVFAVASEAE